MSATAEQIRHPSSLITFYDMNNQPGFWTYAAFARVIIRDGGMALEVGDETGAEVMAYWTNQGWRMLFAALDGSGAGSIFPYFVVAALA